jgi:hypothetical protein
MASIIRVVIVAVFPFCGAQGTFLFLGECIHAATYRETIYSCAGLEEIDNSNTKRHFTVLTQRE